MIITNSSQHQEIFIKKNWKRKNRLKIEEEEDIDK